MLEPRRIHHSSLVVKTQENAYIFFWLKWMWMSNGAFWIWVFAQRIKQMSDGERFGLEQVHVQCAMFGGLSFWKIILCVMIKEWISNVLMRNEFIMGNIKNVLFQDELWCHILEVYKPNHEVTVMSARNFMKSLWRQEESLQVVLLTKEVICSVFKIRLCHSLS